MYVNALGMTLRPVVLSTLSPAGCNVMKLTVDQVIEIRRMHRSGMKQSYLAMKFGVSQQHINRIINKKQWGKRLKVVEDREAHKKLLDAIYKRGV